MPPTQRQQQIRQVIIDMTKERGYPPSMREIAERVGCAPSSIHAVVERLVAQGTLARTPGVARSITVR